MNASIASEPRITLSPSYEQELEHAPELGIEDIRFDPEAYVGDPTSAGALVRMAVAPLRFALGAAAGVPASRVDVFLEAGGVITIVDDGGGLPLASHPALRATMAELLLTRIDHGFVDDGQVPWLARPVVTTALSEWCKVYVYQDGWTWRQLYLRGQAQGPFERRAPVLFTGTRVSFAPDRSILTGLLDGGAVRAQLERFARACPHLDVSLSDERLGWRWGVRARAR